VKRQVLASGIIKYCCNSICVNRCSVFNDFDYRGDMEIDNPTELVERYFCSRLSYDECSTLIDWVKASDDNRKLFLRLRRRFAIKKRIQMVKAIFLPDSGTTHDSLDYSKRVEKIA
jgi:hypothetical protein